MRDRAGVVPSADGRFGDWRDAPERVAPTVLILGGLFTSIRPYLPYTAASTLSGTPLGGSAFGPAHGVSGGIPLPFAAATALLAGLAVLFCAVAARTTVARDVS